MNRNYEFVMSLQDKFSPMMNALSKSYDSKVNQMTRKMGVLGGGTEKLGGVFGKVGKHVDVLHKKITSLGDTQKIKVDSSDLDKATAKAGQFLDKLGRIRNGKPSGGMGGGSASGGSGGLGSMGRIGGMMLGGIGGYLGFEGISRLKESTFGAAMEGSETRFRLQQLMGGSAPVSRLEKSIGAYAPERRDQLLAGAAKLSGSGISESALMPTLKMLNNISALTGQSVEEMALIQSQIKATGYVQGDEINRYKERGINLSPYLAKQMGVNENQIAKLQAKGLITYDILDKAMQKYAGAGGKFDGVYEKRRDGTPTGRTENLTGRINSRLREFGNDSLLPIYTKALDFIDQIFEKIAPLEKAFGNLKAGFGVFAGGVRDVLIKLHIFSSSASTAENIVNLLAFSVNNVARVLNTVGSVIQWFADSPIAKLTAGLFGVWRMIPLVDAAWLALNKSFIVTPIGAAIASVVGLGIAFYTAYEKFEWFRNGVLDGWEGLKVFFENLGTAMNFIATKNWAGLAGLNQYANEEAEKRGKMAILTDKRERNGISDRRRQRGINGLNKTGLDLGNGEFAPFKGSTDGNLGGAGSGISSAVDGSKSARNITINVGSLIAKSEINVMDFNGDIGDLESKIISALSRLLNSANQITLS